MSGRVLSIVESAYRGTLEEQDDTILWFCYTVANAGANIDILLRGNAVNYAVAGQDASGLSFGDRRQTQPPRIDEDVLRLLHAGVRVFTVAEDLAKRGIESADLVTGIEPVKAAALAQLLQSYQHIWHW